MNFLVISPSLIKQDGDIIAVPMIPQAVREQAELVEDIPGGRGEVQEEKTYPYRPREIWIYAKRDCGSFAYSLYYSKQSSVRL